MSCTGEVAHTGANPSGEILKIGCCEPEAAASTPWRRRRREFAAPRIVLVSGIGAPGTGSGGGLGGFTFSHGGMGVVVPPPNGPNTKTGVIASSGGGPIVEH